MIEANRVLIAAGGLAGALGVGLSAAAAHAGGGNLQIAASFLLAHAPALLALSLLAGNRAARLGALALTLGLVLFCGDLVAHDMLGTRLFAFAAPAGGMLMIAGWAAVGLSAVVARRKG